VNLFVAEINFNIFQNIVLPKYFTLMLINGMPNNHAPGSDGFNELFYQRSVGPSLIKQDFISLVKYFFNTSMDISKLKRIISEPNRSCGRYLVLSSPLSSSLDQTSLEVWRDETTCERLTK